MTTAIFSRGRFVVLTLLALFVLPSSSLLAQNRLFAPFAGKQQALNAEQQQMLRKFEQRRASAHVELVRIGDLLPAFRRGTLLINLPDRDEEFIAERNDEEYDPPDYYFWNGRLLSGKGGTTRFGSVTLGGRPWEFTGIIELEGGQWYQIEPLGGGLHALITVDMTRFPTGDDTPPDADDGERQDESPQPALQKTGSSNVTLDVLVLYTDDSYGAVGNIFDTARMAVDRMRTAYRNSGITSSQLNIHHIRTMSLINFQEISDSEATVDRLASNWEANNLRNTWSADVVVLLTDGDYDKNIIGRVPIIGPSNSNAYAIVEADHAIVNYVFAHEVGHLQGARHEDSHRWYDGGTERRTIMYPQSSSAVIQHFSNPSVSYNGIAEVV